MIMTKLKMEERQEHKHKDKWRNGNERKYEG